MAIAVSFAQLLAARLGEESGSTGQHTLLQCGQCQGKASMRSADCVAAVSSVTPPTLSRMREGGDPPLPTDQVGETTPGNAEP